MYFSSSSSAETLYSGLLRFKVCTGVKGVGNSLSSQDTKSDKVAEICSILDDFKLAISIGEAEGVIT